MERDQRKIRREKRIRELETREPVCPNCGETDPVVLTGKKHYILCYECLKKLKGETTMENHHIAGQHNDVFTVPLQANDHRFVSDLQKDWPITTLQNKNESPLLQIAATIRGVMDMLKLFIERVMGWIPEKLEQLNSLLSENDDQWWVTIGFSGVSI